MNMTRNKQTALFAISGGLLTLFLFPLHTINSFLIGQLLAAILIATIGFLLIYALIFLILRVLTKDSTSKQISDMLADPSLPVAFWLYGILAVIMNALGEWAGANITDFNTLLNVFVFVYGSFTVITWLRVKAALKSQYKVWDAIVLALTAISVLVTFNIYIDAQTAIAHTLQSAANSNVI